MGFFYKEYDEILQYNAKNGLKSAKIVAVSKNHSRESVNLAIKHGVRIFGENKVQEAKEKFIELKSKNPNLELHLTGPLQTNKTKIALEIFDVFQTLDREKLALEFIKNNEKFKLKKYFIQVNTGYEKTKSGIMPNIANEFIRFCTKDLLLPVIGLMCIPPINENAKDHFLLLKKIAQENRLKHLSMGMSDDYKEAILCGATYIRIGTKIFGSRYAN